jgi:hypothetical protein
MRQRCLPSSGTLQEKSLSFRPPDPAWAPTAAVQRARAALKAYDPYLGLWWSPAARLNDPVRPGRWTVKEWMPSVCNWDTVLVWESPSGEYRDEFPVDQLVAAVAARSLQGQSFGKRLAAHDAANKARDSRAAAKEHDDGWREANSKARYDVNATKVIAAAGLKK